MAGTVLQTQAEEVTTRIGKLSYKTDYPTEETIKLLREDLVFQSAVQEFQLLGFDAYEKLYRVGYEYAYKRFAAWDGLQRTVSARCNDN